MARTLKPRFSSAQLVFALAMGVCTPDGSSFEEPKLDASIDVSTTAPSNSLKTIFEVQYRDFLKAIPEIIAISHWNPMQMTYAMYPKIDLDVAAMNRCPEWSCSPHAPSYDFPSFIFPVQCVWTDDYGSEIHVGFDDPDSDGVFENLALTSQPWSFADAPSDASPAIDFMIPFDENLCRTLEEVHRIERRPQKITPQEGMANFNTMLMHQVGFDFRPSSTPMPPLDDSYRCYHSISGQQCSFPNENFSIFVEPGALEFCVSDDGLSSALSLGTDHFTIHEHVAPAWESTPLIVEFIRRNCELSQPLSLAPAP